MKSKITAVIALIIIAGTVAWQVSVLNTSKNLAAVINISNISDLPACKSDAQIKALTAVVSEAQKKVNTLASEATKAKSVLNAVNVKIATQDKDLANKLKIKTTTGNALAAKIKGYRPYGSKATTTPEITAAEKAYFVATTKYNESLKIREELEAKRLVAQGNYARFVVPAGAKMSPEAELRSAVLTDAKNILASAFALPKCPASENTVTQCSNKIDDDRDGKVDCQDSECGGVSSCRGAVPGGNSVGSPNTNPNTSVAAGCSDPRFTDEGSCLIATIYIAGSCSNGMSDEMSCYETGGSWTPGQEQNAGNRWNPGTVGNEDGGDLCEMGNTEKPAWFKWRLSTPFKDFGNLVCGNTAGECLSGYSLDGDVKAAKVYGGGYNVSWTCGKMDPYGKCSATEKCNINVGSTGNKDGGGNQGQQE